VSELKQSKEESIALVKDIFSGESVTEEELASTREYEYSKQYDPDWLHRKKYPSRKNANRVKTPKRAQKLGTGKPVSRKYTPSPTKSETLNLIQRSDIQVIELTAQERIKARLLSRSSRELHPDKNGVPQGGVSRIYTDPEKRAQMLRVQNLQGVYGEMALSKFLYGNVDQLAEYTRGEIKEGDGDGGVDLEYRGRRFDTKCSALAPGRAISRQHLLVPKKEWHQGVIYVSCFVRTTEAKDRIIDGMVFLVGWLGAAAVGQLPLQICPDCGYDFKQPSYVKEVLQCRKIVELLDI
jgi:hypothetical protein